MERPTEEEREIMRERLRNREKREKMQIEILAPKLHCFTHIFHHKSD